ncbi:tetratricopeptide repeat protein [Anaerovorax odorimutans]|uniref:Tetratricopeptide repeat protein n=1 Tax=Anaerovorax odorimutans TaxID=109327 RepID=A0ABT1RRP4_9FIRM|nr:tetratricopeptide repeat protein [Anaerovorax odorimutans]MCQ4637556.1 tetratricopeptide repeat protein [Anaerovorax odorimutans]
MNIWDILGIQETNDKKAIQEAYRKKLTVTHPEDSPEEFMALRAALEDALKAADRIDSGDEGEAPTPEETWDDGPVGDWMRRADQLYRHFSRRIDPTQWEELLKEDVCQNLDTKTLVRDALLEYMLDHFFLPQSVVRILDSYFSFMENMDELRESFPQAFLDAVIVESIEQQEYPPYKFLYGDDSLPFDEYLRLSSGLSGCIAEGDTKKGREILEQMKATGIRSPYFQIEKAKICCQEEHYQEAQELIEELLPEYEELSDVRLMRGDICFCLNDYEAARREYSQVLQEEPLSQWGRFGLAKCYVKNGKLKEANEILCQLLQEDPYDQSAEEWLHECNELYIKDLKDRLRADGENQELLFELGWAYFQNGKYENVLELFENIEPEEAHQIQYNSLIGRSCLYGGDEKEALSYIKAWEQCLRNLTDTEENRRKVEDQLPYVFQLESSIYQSLGQTEDALSLLNQLLEQNPRDGEVLRQKGQILYELWDFEGAVDALTGSIEADRNSHVSYLMRAKAFFHMDYYGEAFDDCERALEIYPYELAAYVYKIKILIEAGELEEAEETIAYLEGEEISGSELEFLKGYIEEARERYLYARRIYYKIIEDTEAKSDQEGIFEVENLAEVYHHLAVMEYNGEEDDFTSVVELIDQGLAVDERYVPLLEMKAEIAQECDRPEDALRLYQRIREAAPGRIGICGMIDGVYRELEQWDKALEYANLQLQQTESAYAYMRRGQILTCLDRLDEAWEDFSKAVRLDPELEYTYNYMGVILEFRDQEEEALSYYRKAIDMGEQTGETCEEAYANAANLHCRRGEYEKARQLLQAVYEKTKETKYLCQQIEICRLSGDFSKARQALEAYKRAEQLGDYDFIYRWEKAHIFRDEKQTADALVIYESEGKSEPAALKEAGKLLYYKGKYRKALKYFFKAIAGLDREHCYEEPEFVEADYHLWAARASLKLGKKDDAALFARNGLKKIPDDFERSLGHCLPMIYQMMGALYATQGDYTSAQGFLEKALQLRKCDYCNYGCCIDALYELGYLYELTGDKERALNCYKEGLRFAPADNDLSSAAANLE